MLDSGWRWVRAKRRRTIGCVFGLIFAALAFAWFWRDFCLWRADANLILRNEAAAEEWVRRGLWGRTRDQRTCLVEIRIARRRGRFDDVQQLLRQARKLGAPAGELQRQAWLAQAQTQQFEQVSPHWHELLADPRDDEPEIARAFVIWASAHHRLSDAQQLLTLWEQDYPDDPEPYALSGQLAHASNHWEGAITAYRKALALAPDNDGYRLELALALQNRLELDEAMQLYRVCIQHDPANLSAIKGLAQTYATQGEIEQALFLLHDAVQRFPGDVDLRQALGEVLLAEGDSAAAVEPLQRAYTAYPENADLAYSLARALKGTGRGSEAQPLFDFVAESREPLNSLKTLEEQLANHPDDVELRYKIASISAKYKSRAEAIRWLEKLLLIAPNHLPAHEALCELYELTGNAENARRERDIVAHLQQALPSTSSGSRP